MVLSEEILNATEYLSIIADKLHLYMSSVFPTANGMFQQDNDLCHKARIVLELIQNHDAEFHLMFCPSNSADLNTSEFPDLCLNICDRQSSKGL